MKYNVLTIDDEVHILELLKYNLESNGFSAFEAETVAEGMEVLENNQIDIILLDVMLPDMDGVTALRNLKQSKYKDIPVIMVTAKVEEIDKIIGLELGADDYICKPFSVRELIARVKVISRRYKKESEAKVISEVKETEILQFKELKMDIVSHLVSVSGTPLLRPPSDTGQKRSSVRHISHDRPPVGDSALGSSLFARRY